MQHSESAEHLRCGAAGALVPDGSHLVVAGHGYNNYHLNCLAGSARSRTNTEGPDHTWGPFPT